MKVVVLTAIAWLGDASTAWASPEAHGGGHGGEHDGFADIVWWSEIIGNEGKTGVLILFINFAVLMWLLEKILFSKLRTKTANTHDQIKGELERATKARAEAESIISNYSERLDRLDQEIEELMAEAKERAEVDRKSIIEAAEKEAARIKASARAAAERDAESRRREIENEVIDRAVDRAEAVLREKFTPTDQRNLLDDYIEQLAGVDIAKTSGAATSGQGQQA